MKDTVRWTPSTPETQLTSKTGKYFWEQVEGKKALEIGPFDGWYTKLMLECNPLTYTVIESNPNACRVLKDSFPEIRIINRDASLEIDKLNEEFDVVILLGVLYHLPSPFHLLERIVNVCKPATVILDILGDVEHKRKNSLVISNEKNNVPGNRHIEDGEKSCKLSMGVSEDIILLAMKNLGYIQEKSHIYNPTKTIFCFRKITKSAKRG